ncbi:MAG: glycosyl transferase [Verrucomicrobia bacterium]|nr:glycosyl transferase [Verrucomicrobiota bacterium]
MKLNFCTLFDSHYLSRGMAMIKSLKRNCPDFHLYIFPFDDKCLNYLRKINLPNVTLVSLKEFEDEQLLAAKTTRTRTEYCWTCTSSVILYCLEKFRLPNCIYVDADLFFYHSPQVLIDEKPGDHHVIITAHRYTWYYDKSKLSGKYCVQFMYFDDSEASMKVIRWWRDRCIEWCYNRMEDGKFGDQKYLDDWTTRFEGVWELHHPGGGLAPWNIQQYTFENIFEGKELKATAGFLPVFYHFHGIRFYDNGKIIYAPNTYRISKQVRRIFYDPYVETLQKIKSEVAQTDSSFDPNGSQPSSSWFKDRFVNGKLNYIMKNYLDRLFNFWR